MDSRLPSGVLGASTAGPDTGAFTDLNRLNNLKIGGDSQANIEKVAKEFESLFLNEMLKAMRAANAGFGEGNFMNSSESKTYQDMYDQQLSVSLSNNQNGIGLADVLARQMAGMKSGSERPNPFDHTANATTAVENTASASVSHALTTLPAKADSSRNDSALLNRRRLSLPSKLHDRLLAGISPAAKTVDATGKPLAQQDWLAASAYAAPADKGLSINGQEPVSASTAKSVFSSPADFIATMMPMAEKAAAKIGVEARYLVAQAALETGWGKSIIRQQDGSTSHNLFGIKSHNSWAGESAKVMTTEYKNGSPVQEPATFRAYDSFAQSFNDYVSFLQSNGRYEGALKATDNPERFVQKLQQAGYATDPNYARKISQIARKMSTYQTIAAAGNLSNQG